MGSMLGRRCWTNYTPEVIAPDPNPSNYKILEKKEYKNGYVLKVHYFGCTNFEGIKVMVYKGKYIYQDFLDPHFAESGISPIARFRPDAEGMLMAMSLASSL